MYIIAVYLYYVIPVYILELKTKMQTFIAARGDACRCYAYAQFSVNFIMLPAIDPALHKAFVFITV